MDEVRAERPDLLVHAANSAATLRDPAAHFDMVRCGVAIYGLDPFQGDPAERGLEPALALESWVAAVRDFEPGDGAGYGRTWRAERATAVATVPIGYGDGWRRGLSNDCDVLIRGRRHPVVGTVSMDNITVEVGRDSQVEVGDTVTLIGRQGDERIRAEEVARAARDDQLRDHLRPLAAGAPAAGQVSGPLAEALRGRQAWIVGGTVRDELLGPPGHRRGRGDRGRRRAAARAVARRSAGPSSRSRSASARGGRSTASAGCTYDLSELQGETHRGGSRAPRLHGERDGPAGRGREPVIDPHRGRARPGRAG